jgi:hypothetical protein
MYHTSTHLKKNFVLFILIFSILKDGMLTLFKMNSKKLFQNLCFSECHHELFSLCNYPSIHSFWHRLYLIWCHKYDLNLQFSFMNKIYFLISVRSDFPPCLQANFGIIIWDKAHKLPGFHPSPCNLCSRNSCWEYSRSQTVYIGRMVRKK